MRTFRISKKISIVADASSTRNGFKHTATLMINGRGVDSTKVNYLNRTWERFEFQTVMKRLIEKTNSLNKLEKKLASKWLDGDRTDWTDMKMTGMIAGLGDIMTSNKKEANAWKKRMLNAGLGSKGLIMPEGFDKLSQKVQQKRLDKVIKEAMNIDKKIMKQAGLK